MFETALREGIDRTQDGLRRARRDGDPDGAYRHSARLLDLIDRAHRNGIDTAEWVDPELVAVAWATAGDD